MLGEYTFIDKKQPRSVPVLRASLFSILSLILISCAPSHKYLGTKQPGLANSACPVESEFCAFNSVKWGWKVNGTYFVERTDSGVYRLHGSVKLDVEEVSHVFQSISKLNLTFVFFQGDLVVLEEVVRLKGAANEYIKFSHNFETDNIFDSSAWAWWDARVTELPPTQKSKTIPADTKSLPTRTYIRIESDDQFFENNRLKFKAQPGDILEVIRVKTCLSGSGICWQVRNIKTGETGFNRADALKQRHTVFTEKEVLEGSEIAPGKTSADSPKLEELTEQRQTIILNGFSIVAPNEPYWNCIRRNTRGEEVSLTKKGTNPDETYAINVFTGQLPQFANNEAFVSFVRDDLSSEQDARFIERALDAEAVSTKNGVCVNATSKVKDLLAVKKTSNPSPMILEAVTLVCRNPDNKSEGVILAYSHRYYPGQWNPPLSDKAKDIFESLVFGADLKAKSNEVCP